MAMKHMPDESRVWVYQGDREFTKDEIPAIQEKVSRFIESWTSHSKQVKADFDFLYNRFLILVLDESHVQAGGCSIDSSVHFIKSLESEFHNVLTDRMKFAFKNGSEVQVVSRDEFSRLIAEGKINDDTVVFNNLVASLGELNSSWEIPLSKSWHRQFFAVKF